MEFKYKHYHSKLSCSCPPTNLKTIEQKVYRWVHKDLNHKNDFIPPYEISPKRVNGDNPCKVKCQGYALSLFTSVSKAETKLKRLLDDKPNLSKVLGDCIAEGDVKHTDGKCDKPDKDGHFNFHEFKGVNLRPNFVFVKKVPYLV